MYAAGGKWQNWMKDYEFGTLVFVPNGTLRSTVDRLRLEYDSVSASNSMAHITITQPFSKKPSDAEVLIIQDIINSLKSFEIIVGPFTTSPNRRLNWLDVAPKQMILDLREQLHGTGLFRTDLPLTKGFIPHMTISEEGRDPDEVNTINAKLNGQLNPWPTLFKSVTWIIPDEDFVFKEHRSFDLE